MGGKPEGVDERKETVDGKPETVNNGNAQSSANIGGNRSDCECGWDDGHV